MVQKSSIWSSWKVLLGAGLASLTTLGVLYYWRDGKKERLQAEPSPRQLAQVVQRIALTMDPKQKLSAESLKLIYRGHYELAQEYYAAEITRARESRRKVIKDLPAYIRKIGTSAKRVEALLDKKLCVLVEHLGLSKGEYLAQVQQWMGLDEFNPSEWAELVEDQVEFSLLRMRNTQKPPIKESALLSILFEKINVLHCMERDQLLQPFESQLNDKPFKVEVIDTYVCDTIYEKFKVEEEDLNYSYSLLKEEEKIRIKQAYEKISYKMSQMVKDPQAQEDYY